MKEIDPVCPACQVRMREGFMLDETHGGRHPVFWVQGPPERSRLVGVKLRQKEIWVVESYRCPDCGFLKSYARERKR